MSLIIKILGTGCPKCKQTTSVVTDAVNQHNIDASIEKVEDIMAILNYNVISTPAIVINEKVVLQGHVPSKAELDKIFIAGR